MPTAQQPVAPKKREPAAQKPDIKLPLDAIRAGRLGEKPLSKHIEKHEKKRKADAKKASTKGGAKPAGAIPGSSIASERGRRGTRPGTPAATDGAALGGREQRQLKRKRSSGRRRKSGEREEGKFSRRSYRRIRRTGANTAAPRKSNVVVELPCTVRTFSEAIGVSAGQVLGKLLTLGAAGGLNINAELDPEMAELLTVELGVEVDFRHHVELEDQLLPELEHDEEDPTLLKSRPPVITFLGHVDHGKTSLLDRIIGIDVVSGEKGGITQHIRAYRIEKDGRSIAFVDTPGHEAFTEMRARGANVTDIAVLVVAADDGVMPQTEEAISHARAAGVPIVVALNKIDIPGVTTQRAYEQLAANELLPSEWGGDTEVIKTSATTGEGVDELLDTLLTVAELHEYQANPDRAPAARASNPSCTKDAAWSPNCWSKEERSTSATSWFADRLSAGSRRCTTRSSRGRDTKRSAPRLRSTSPVWTRPPAPATASTSFPKSPKHAKSPNIGPNKPERNRSPEARSM